MSKADIGSKSRSNIKATNMLVLIINYSMMHELTCTYKYTYMHSVAVIKFISAHCYD